MIDHEKILRMIEGVDPKDAETLDEIDAWVWCWLEGHRFIGWYIDGTDAYEDKDGRGIFYIEGRNNQYTRSRDALKAIRPEGWEPIGCNDDLIGGFSGGWKFTMYNVTPFIDRRHKVTSAYCKTEELAELHAIIQAIAYERKEK